jgi:hypothetical protein
MTRTTVPLIYWTLRAVGHKPAQAYALATGRTESALIAGLSHRGEKK